MAQSNPSCYVEDSFVEYIQVALCSPKIVESDAFIIGVYVGYTLWLG